MAFFFVFALAVYLLINLYVYRRCRTVLLQRRHTLVSSLLFSALALAFPVAEMLSHVSHASWTEPLVALGFFSLPFMLYLLLLVVLLDLFLVLNRLTGIVPARVIGDRMFRLTGLCLLIVIPLGIVIAGTLRFSDIRINKYRIDVARKSSTLSHLRIALASDFHLDEMTETGFLDRFAGSINSLNVDALLIPGDLFEGSWQGERARDIACAFRRIHTTYGTYATLGNHESYGGVSNPALYDSAGITLLRDSVLEIDRGFTIVGRNFNYHAGRKPIGQLMSSVSRELPSIVLDHSPAEIDRIASTGADVVVSGHTHHGQLFPFNFITEMVYRVSWGHQQIGHTHVFVTSGIRLWGPPVRTAGDSEIMVIDAAFVDDSLRGAKRE